MKTQGSVALARVIAERELTHIEVERLIGYPEESGLVTRLVNGERGASMKVAAACEREFGIAMAAWTVEVPERSQRRAG